MWGGKALGWKGLLLPLESGCSLACGRAVPQVGVATPEVVTAGGLEAASPRAYWGLQPLLIVTAV